MLWPKAQGGQSANARVARQPVTIPSDSRSPIARAYQWASRIMVVSLEMVLPGLAGYWIDQRLGTKVVFMLAGFALGGTGAMIHLIRMTRTDNRKSGDKRS